MQRFDQTCASTRSERRVVTLCMTFADFEAINNVCKNPMWTVKKKNMQ